MLMPRYLDRQFQPEMVDHSTLKCSTILALNGRPFKAGIVNQIFN